MKLPSLSSLGLLFGSLLLPTIIEAQRPGYPTIDVPPPAEANWTALVDLSKAPKVPVRTAGACPTGDPYCTWSCTQCTKPDTDIVKCPKANDWGITYDDGPSPYTPVILDHLKAKGVKATFFVIGSRVTNNPDILKRTVAEGHQIGIHTWSHTPLTTQTSEVVIAELKWTEKIIKEVTGLTPKFMRPPQGDYDDRIRYISKSLGYKIVVWDDDTFDWKSNTDSTFDLNWITGNFTQWVKDKSSGHISLEHDLYQKTAGMAPKAIDIVMGAGFSIKDVATCTGLVPYLESNATTSNSTLSTPTGTSATASSTNATASSTNIPAGKSIATKNNNNNFLLGIVSAIVFSIIFSSF